MLDPLALRRQELDQLAARRRSAFAGRLQGDRIPDFDGHVPLLACSGPVAGIAVTGRLIAGRRL